MKILFLVSFIAVRLIAPASFAAEASTDAPQLKKFASVAVLPPRDRSRIESTSVQTIDGRQVFDLKCRLSDGSLLGVVAHDGAIYSVSVFADKLWHFGERRRGSWVVSVGSTIYTLSNSWVPFIREEARRKDAKK